MRSLLVAVGLGAVTLLAACEPTEERVERLYSEAQELAAAGEPERARLLLKNLFNLDGYHRDARLLYADQSLLIGRTTEAYRHYLLVAEQNPDFAPVRVTLAEMAAQANDWEEAERHLEAAEAAGAETTGVQAVRVAVDYRAALAAEDSAEVATVRARAEALVASDPEAILGHRVLIDTLVQDGRSFEALDALDTALSVAPLDPEFNRVKLGLLAQTQQTDQIGEHLRTLVDRFPEDEAYQANLVAWYLANDDLDGAEAFIRGRVDAAEPGDTSAQSDLVSFLRQIRGDEAALAELDRIVAETDETLAFERLRGAILFDMGRRDEALAALDALLETSEPSADRRDLQITLARMNIVQGDNDRARALVDAVLAEDETHVEALVMRAGWMIEEDRTRDAILTLRIALDQSPRNVPAMNMMAAAYERDGNRDLMGETLLLAANASGFRADESLRYARFLVSEDKLRPAEDTLLSGLRSAPGNLALLGALGEVYLLMADWPRVEQVIASIDRLDAGDEARALSTSLQATLLQRMERTDESIALLRSLIDSGEAGLSAHAAVIRAHLGNGDVAAARGYLDGVMAEDGAETNEGLAFLNAALLTVEGDTDAAMDVYRGLLADEPRAEIVWRALAVTALRGGTPEARQNAQRILDEALSHLPQSDTLLWMKASLEEQDGNIDAAIAIYEQMYERNSSSSIVANNLASLITTHRTDDESLQRAYVIARRLRGSGVPAFRDTYGWIAYRMGNFNEAEEHLAAAAADLPNDPLVQYHLGKTYAALDRRDAATQQFEKALDLWQDAALPQAEDARSELERLSSAPSVQPQE